MPVRDYNSIKLSTQRLTYIFSHITVKDTGYKTPCWLWTRRDGTISDTDQYYQFYFYNVGYVAHRLMYVWFVEPMQDDSLVIDHLCRCHPCINPAHLELVSVRENVLRGVGVPAKNAQKQVCQNGHDLTPDNIYFEPNGNGRKCRICRNVYATNKRRRKGQKERSLTHCQRGHIFNEVNTYTHPKTGLKNCRVCRNIRAAIRRHTKAAPTVAPP